MLNAWIRCRWLKMLLLVGDCCVTNYHKTEWSKNHFLMLMDSEDQEFRKAQKGLLFSAPYVWDLSWKDSDSWGWLRCQGWDSWEWEDHSQDSFFTCLLSDWDSWGSGSPGIVTKRAYMWLFQNGGVRVIGFLIRQLSALRVSVPWVRGGGCMVSYELALGLT